MSWRDFSVKVPASTANLGPGFDSIGMALDLYLTITVCPSPTMSVEYVDPDYRQLPCGTDNLIIATARKVAARYHKQLPTVKLNIETDIPLGRGLGSSASAIAGGIEIADRLLDLKMSQKEKVEIGSEMEGHPDNISASFMGGLTISYDDGTVLETIHVPHVDIGVIILVPPAEFLTAESRELLPETLRHSAATRGSAAGNVLSAALALNDWKTVGRMMERDTFHEPYRQSMFPDFEAIRSFNREIGAFGSVISGAGPSLFVAVEKGEEQGVAEKLKIRFPHYQCLVTKPSEAGIMSYETVQ
ncbi:homoserine kinase [Planococcus salinus]|uniref:Homoserine kinase n=1 Tax=Planococcus salinus TaxID=1848460 RepID=A0A3M8P405_9BACL|nr:homoserine kinase [Planococcus salinus]RNF38397.1 homoserine kinase [Planococcus salinus]